MANERKIALEEHFVTPELARYAQVGDAGASDIVQALRERLMDFGSLRLEAMDRAGIEISVLSVTTPGVQGEADAALAVRLAKAANDTLAREVQKRPDRYAGFAHLPLQDPHAAADEFDRCVTELGFVGAMVNGHSHGEYLDDRKFDPFWERVEALGRPVCLHRADTFYSPYMSSGRPELLGATGSWTVETATHALRLVFGGVFERYPDVQLILGHMGETLPYLLWRLDSRSRMQAGLGLGQAKAPSETIRRNIAVTTTGVCSHKSLLCALAALGEDNVMFSVGYPYEDSEVAARFIETAPISAAARAKVCRQNATRLLRL